MNSSNHRQCYSFWVVLVTAFLLIPAPGFCRDNREAMEYLKNSKRAKGMKNLNERDLELNQYQTLNQTSKRYIECVKRSLHGDRDNPQCRSDPDADACVGAVKALQYSKRKDDCIFKMHRFCLRNGYKHNTQIGWFNVAQKHFENAAICIHRKSGKNWSDQKRSDLASLDGLEVKTGDSKDSDDEGTIQKGKSEFKVDDIVRSVKDGSEEFGLEAGAILKGILNGKKLAEIVAPPTSDSEAQNSDNIAAEKETEEETEKDATAEESEDLIVSDQRIRQIQLDRLMKVVDAALLTDAEKNSICGSWGFLSKQDVERMYAKRTKKVKPKKSTDRSLASLFRSMRKASRPKLSGVSRDTTLFAAVRKQYRKQTPEMLGLLLEAEGFGEPDTMDSLMFPNP